MGGRLREDLGVHPGGSGWSPRVLRQGYYREGSTEAAAGEAGQVEAGYDASPVRRARHVGEHEVTGSQTNQVVNDVPGTLNQHKGYF